MMENEVEIEPLSDGSVSGIAAEFYGMDRDEESVSEHVEGIIAKDEVTAAEAMDILELLLQNATGYIIHEYTQYDTTGSVEKLGLASDILEMVPFDGKSMENGATGKLPSETLVGAFLVVTGLIIFFAIAIATLYFFINLGRLLANWGMDLLASFAEGAKAALEAAIKIIILVFVILMLGILILVFTLIFAFLVILFSIMNIVNIETGFYYLYSKNSSGSVVKGMNISIPWVRNDFLDMDLPIVQMNFIENNIIIRKCNIDFLFSNNKIISTDDPINDIKKLNNPSNNKLTTDSDPTHFDELVFDLIGTLTTILYGISLIVLIWNALYALVIFFVGLGAILTYIGMMETSGYFYSGDLWRHFGFFCGVVFFSMFMGIAIYFLFRDPSTILSTAESFLSISGQMIPGTGWKKWVFIIMAISTITWAGVVIKDPKWGKPVFLVFLLFALIFWVSIWMLHGYSWTDYM
ncbi:MAG: hypothetical protein GF329_20090 [Candidatus Lokiarchaeota archaeon]|nr:hypothetical protein [Candidatus Lokiarchaeota archaeon]